MIGKRGVFALFIALLTFLVLSYTYVLIIQKEGKIERQMGELQIDTLKAIQMGEQAKAYQRAAAQMVVQQAVLSAAARYGCEKYFGFPIWREECLGKPALKATFDAVVQERMRQYQNPIVSVAVVETAIIDTAVGAMVHVVPTEIPEILVHCSGTECGSYRFSMATEITTPYRFDEVREVLGSVERVQGELEQCGDTGCVEQVLNGMDTPEFDFSTACMSAPEAAFWTLLEEINRCASGPQCGCGNVEDVLDMVNAGLHPSYAIKIDPLEHTAMLVHSPTGATAVVAPFLEKGLCADGARSVWELIIRPGAHPENALLMQANGERIVPIHGVSWEQPFICFSQQEQQIPPCELPAVPVKGCAISQQKFWHFDTVLREVREDPVVYRFALD